MSWVDQLSDDELSARLAARGMAPWEVDRLVHERDDVDTRWGIEVLLDGDS